MTERPASFTVALLGLAPAVRTEIVDLLGDRAIGTARPEDADVVVVGGRGGDPLQRAQRLVVADPKVAVLILPDGERADELRRRAAVAPLLGPLVRLVDALAPEAVVEAIDELWAQSRTQRRWLETVRAVAAQLGDAPTDPLATRRSPGEGPSRDPLTNLPTREVALRRMESTLTRAADPSRVCVAFVDLDDFKLINDSRGHAVGDEVLRAVAVRLRGVVRPEDAVTRYGGDEFVIVAEDVEDMDGFGRRLAEVFSEPVAVEGGPLWVRASIGVAPGHSRDPEQVIGFADRAMYRAKAAGGDCLIVADRALAHEAERRRRMVRELPAALSRGDVVAGLAPMVRLPDGKPVGVELLARWHHPELGELPASEFLPVAAELGLAGELGRCVVGDGLRRVRGMIDSGSITELTINLSAQELIGGDEPAAWLHRLLAESAIPPSVLWIDLRQEDLANAMDAIPDRLARLRVVGARFAVEEISGGGPGLEALRGVMVDRVKIDMQRVFAVPAPAHRRALAESIVGVARALGATVVANRVEDHGQAELAVVTGCARAQGWFYGSPAALS